MRRRHQNARALDQDAVAILAEIRRAKKEPDFHHVAERRHRQIAVRHRVTLMQRIAVAGESVGGRRQREAGEHEGDKGDKGDDIEGTLVSVIKSKR